MPVADREIIIDVRTPSEYLAAHIPGAHNLPLFTDEERAAVGTTYVQKSREDAVKLGLDLVGPKLGEMVRRAEELAGLPKEGRKLLLYCARGGMRSSSVAWMLGLAGFNVRTLPGGFKSYKQRLNQYATPNLPLIVLAGATGAGKTDLLHLLKKRGEQILDLEGLAQHRGSAFGYLPGVTQPTNEMMHCLLVDALEGLDFSRPIYTESESLKIGRVSLPEAFFKVLGESDYILVDTPREVRAKRIVDLYGELDRAFLEECFRKIEKRIGGANKKLATEALENGDLLLPTEIALDYYDKAYARSSEEIYKGRCLGRVTSPSGDLSEMADQILALRLQ